MGYENRYVFQFSLYLVCIRYVLQSVKKQILMKKRYISERNVAAGYFVISIITNSHKSTLQKASLPISDIAEVIPLIILSSSGRRVADQLSNDPTDNCVSAWDDRANGRPHVGDLLGHPLGQRVLRELGEGGGEEVALVRKNNRDVDKTISKKFKPGRGPTSSGG